MTTEKAWKIWFAILHKLEENGHDMTMNGLNGECGGNYVNTILRIAKQFE